RFLEAVANHVGIGVKKAGLFEETGRRARELAAVHAVTAAVSGSLDLEHILLKGLDTVLEVTEMEAGYILFLAEEPPKLIIKAHRGMSSSFVANLQDRIQPGGKIEQIIATKKPLLLENISPAHKGRFGGERITAAAWVPILSKEKVIGILTITSRTKRTVPQDRLPLLASIGNALSAALENARLFDDTKRNLERIRTLHEINLAVTSTLDLKSVLDTLLAKLEEALSFAFVATIRMFNQETRATELLACRNIAAETCRQAVPDGTLGLSGVVLESLAPAVILNAPKDPRTANPGFFIENGLVSYVGLPLIAQGQTLGILAIFTKEEREFSGKEIEFLSAVAGHGAAAIHNSQLYHSAHAAREKQEEANLRLSELLRQITGLYAALAPLGASENPAEMLETFIDRFCLAAGADGVSFRIFDENTASFSTVVHRGFAAEYVEELSSRERATKARDVYQSGEPLFSADLAGDPRFLQKKQLKAGYRSCAFLPFKVKGKVRGIIHLSSRTLGFFSEEKKEHLLALSRLVEIVFENRDLFDDVKSARDSLEKANERLKARTIQQAVLNHFSHLALSAKAIPALLDEAAIEVALVLRVDYCEVLELLPESDCLVLRAGTGWRSGQVGRATTSSRNSHARYTLAQDGPVVISDLAREARFKGSTLLCEHGVTSGVAMTILGQERPFGLIGAYTSAPRTFNEEEIHFLMSFAYILATAFDRVQAEQKLRESQRRYENLVESIEGIVWEADARTFQTTFVSHQAERILGFPIDEWLRDPAFWRRRVHAQDRRWAMAFCKKATYEMRPFELECRLIAADGRTLWFRHIVTVVTENHRPAKLRGVSFDVTEHRRMEREVSEISERERQRIGRDLHDELGQFLTGIACIGSSLAQELEEKSLPEARTAAQIADLTNQAINQTRTLARGLYPVELQAHGLLSALQELAGNAETMFSISCRLSYDPAVSAPADDVAIHLYRIAQEAIDNAVRHGRARHIWLRLSEQNGIGLMSVVDDGAGLAEPREHKGMGLRIMKYRAEMIGGILQIRRGQQGGTIVECSFQRRDGREGRFDGETDRTTYHDEKKIHPVGG
ncbi:MAG TPA: GAF domain-containing protein, partial [Candidatus Binatia bacterium]